MNEINILIQNLKDKLIEVKKSNMVIAIDGRGGSGKTTLSKQISENLGDVEVLNLDAYQENSSDLFSQENINRNFEIDFENRKFALDRIKDKIEKSPKQFIILEGCFSFKNLTGISVDYEIWLEIDKKEAEQRLNNREKVDRKDISFEIIELSTRKYQEAEDRYIESFKPQEVADFILTI